MTATAPQNRGGNMGQQSVIGTTPDCKSGPYGIVGSSPTWPTKRPWHASA